LPEIISPGTKVFVAEGTVAGAELIDLLRPWTDFLDIFLTLAAAKQSG
jgi:hypothetical protein